MGSGNFDEIQDQRFAREPRLAAPGRTPVKTFVGVGGSGENPVYVEPEVHIKSFSGPADFGNLPPRVPANYKQEPVGLRSPVKTY